MWRASPRGEGHIGSKKYAHLVDELLQKLERRGVPEGAWLVDIARIRQELRDADELLLRLQNAIIDAAVAQADQDDS
jgi:hypothetical protein